MWQLLIPIAEKLVASAGTRVGQQVIKNLVFGKQSSALLKIVNPYVRGALKELEKLQKFRASGKKGFGEWFKFNAPEDPWVKIVRQWKRAKNQPRSFFNTAKHLFNRKNLRQMIKIAFSWEALKREWFLMQNQAQVLSRWGKLSNFVNPLKNKIWEDYLNSDVKEGVPRRHE